MAIFTNQAQLTYNGRTILSNVTQGVIAEPYAISKTPLGDTYSAGDTKTYVLALTNSSSSALSGVSVTDDLGAYTVGTNTYYPLTFTGPILAYVNGTFAGEITPTATTPTLTFTLPTVPAGGNVVVVYDTQVNSFAPLATDSQIVNTVTVSGGGITAPLTAEATISAEEDALLSILKSVTPTTVNDGVVTYTFTIENFGNVESADAVLTDTFDPILTGITVALNGTPLSDPDDYTYNEATGLLTTAPGTIVVPAATYTTAPDGSVEVTPGTVTLTVTGNLT